jgi:hypothetical protein
MNVGLQSNYGWCKGGTTRPTRLLAQHGVLRPGERARPRGLSAWLPSQTYSVDVCPLSAVMDKGCSMLTSEHLRLLMLHGLYFPLSRQPPEDA